MSEEWTSWIEWFPGPMPVAQGTIVKAEMGYSGSGDIIGPLSAEDFDWVHEGDPIARYKVRRPRALLQLIDMAENLPAPKQREEA